ncbi:MAG TPA: response regulator, partial [Herpetosiphonaceae bacterium]|nr:response regulator [Herpetosiphonaceae bacterium]
DDNADMRAYITRLLAPDYAVIAVDDGAAALQAIQETAIDLVLTDVMMPRLDGFGLLSALRADPRTHTLPVILLSARAGEESRIEGMGAGADDYLVKPFSARELRARVTAHLSMARLRQAAALREQDLRAEAQAARERLDEVLSRIDDQVFALDHAWRYVFVNDQVLQMVGRAREDLLGRCIWDLFPDIAGTPFERQLRQAVAEQTPSHFEYAYPALGRWFDNHVYPSASGVTLFVADITARKEAEAALRLSEERVRLALAAADLGAWDFRPAAGTVIGDARCAALTGLPPDTPVTYHAVLERLHPEDAAALHAALRLGLDPASDGRVSVTCRLRDGDECWLAVNGQVFRDPSGVPLRVIGTLLDITEFKRVEAERAQLLAQEQHLRQQAEAVSRLKDEFLATVSHELRTPLTALLGYAQMLQSRPRDDAYIKRTAGRMLHAAKSQAQLIEDLLDVSRIVSGKLRLEAQPTDLASVIRSALDTVRPAIEAKTLHVHVDLQPEASRVIGDPHRLEQIVWNLLSNATKFTPPGGQVTIALEQDGPEVLLTVSDTGQGISAAFLPFVFDRFRQADGTSMRSHGGLGLGMAIVRHLVELHGGTVAVASPGEGQGATFTIRLPRAPEGYPDPTALAMADLPDPACPPGLAGRRVLIVDDQAGIRDLVSDMLTSCGMIVEECSTAAAALDRVRIWRPDVLISDIAMPDADGYWLITQVRSLAREDGGETPAIALTAYVRIEERLRPLEAGFQRYVPKPIDIADLRTAVASVLNGESDPNEG